MSNGRLFKIVHYLLVHEKTTAKALAELCEVSVRTIHRDIDALTLADVPVYCTRGKEGGIHLMEGYVVDRSMLVRSEQQALLEVFESLHQVMGAEGDALLLKLKALFGEVSNSWLSIDFSRWGSARGDEETFELLKRAILEKRVINFEYYSSYAEVSHKRVKPIQLKYKSKAWYVEGFCMAKCANRLYRLSRLFNLKVTSEHFNAALLPQAQSAAVKEKPVYPEIELIFGPSVAYRVMDDFDASTIVRAADGRLRVRTYMPEDDWLCGYLLSFGGQVEVVAPESLKTTLESAVERLYFRYFGGDEVLSTKK